jgi:nicotinamidase-related amidase
VVPWAKQQWHLKENPMTISALDPKSALILIDLQQGIVARPAAHPVAEILGRARALADAFRGRGLPVVLVNVEGGAPGRAEQPRSLSGLPAGWTELMPELHQQPSDHRVTKRTWGAFRNTGLEAFLKEAGVTQVVLGGISTSAGVESTGRQAHEAGFNVAFAVDAMTDMDAEAHRNSVTRIFPRVGETGSTAEILQLLDQGRP